MSARQPPSPANGPLPRGRHKLGREAVLSSQRRRLIAAAGTAVAEQGYWPLKVADITDRARVSRATFYVHFEDKLDCLLSAHEDALEELLATIEAACEAVPEWPRNVVAAVHGAVGFAITSPAAASLLSIDAAGVEHTLADQMLDGNRRLVGLLREASERGGQPAALPELTERAMVAAAASVIGASLKDTAPYEIAGLASPLAQIILVPYLGLVGAQLAADAYPRVIGKTISHP